MSSEVCQNELNSYDEVRAFPKDNTLTLSWPAGHICPAGQERVKIRN